jgi:integrase
MTARRFGNVRKLPSGRYQARWKDGEQRDHLAPTTFVTSKEAVQWLTDEEAALRLGNRVDPDKGRITLREYSDDWLDGRPDLRPRTRELYRSLLDNHVLDSKVKGSTVPALGHLSLAALDVTTVKKWRARLLKAGVGEVTVAKSYRLLRTILNGAVEDGRIVANPCTIKRAGIESSPERPTATMAEVEAIADGIEPRFRALVLLAAFSGLRFGELSALTRSRIDLGSGKVTVAESAVELRDGSRLVGQPKTQKSRRTVALPPQVVAALTGHLERYVAPEPAALCFTGPLGAPIRRGNFHKVWERALERSQVGTAYHFHDLRHTGNTLAAATGASTAELMARMGHSSPRAALIYQHATAERDEAIAEKLGLMIAEQRKSATQKEKPASRSRGTTRTRRERTPNARGTLVARRAGGV